MSLSQLHKSQILILHSLRYAPSARFNELMRPTGHPSDTFKFHLQKLMKLGYVTKLEQDIGYQLTPLGKEFANNLDETRGTPKKQPKLSVLIVAPRQRENGETRYLLQRRSRNPHYGFWNEITDAVQWGESFEQAAARVLLRQTGLRADFTVCAMRRVRDYDAEVNSLLEDKLFVIVEAISIRGELTNTYAGGKNSWLSVEELQKQQKYFASTVKMIKMVEQGEYYAEQDIAYSNGAY